MAEKNETLYDNNLRGALFQNKERTTEKQPHYRGTCEIGGLQYFISGWKKRSKKGDIYMSVSFTLKPGQSPSGSESSDQNVDDIPF